MINRTNSNTRRGGVRFLEQCREHLGITGLARYTGAWYEPLIWGVNVMSRGRYRYGQVVALEQGIIADAIQNKNIPTEYIEELVMDCAPAHFLDLLGPTLTGIISRIVEEGRLSLSPEAVYTFQVQLKRRQMELSGFFLMESTEPFSGKIEESICN